MSLNKYTIKQILKEHWEDFLFKHHHLIPVYVHAPIEKMLSCRDPKKLGYHKYSCPDHPEQSIIIPNSCKSSFCNSCGKILTDKFVAKVESNFPNMSFHHICFTVPDSLRKLLDKNRFLLNCLFKAASQTLLTYCKERHFLPLIIAALHTFGRDLKFHPHIHLLITSGGLLLKNGNPINKWKDSPFFPFKMLHKRYRSLLIDIFKKTIKKHIQSNPCCGELSVFSHPGVLDSFFDPLLEINWYVHDSKALPPEDFTVAYIVRYTKRPPIAQSRILHYGPNPEIDPSNPEQIWVTFSFKLRNQPQAYRSVQPEEFIRLLIQHILPPNFRQVRYYGALANRVRTNLTKTVFKLCRRQKQLNQSLSWQQRVVALTGKDPLACPICQRPMRLVEIAYFSKKSDSLKYYYPP